MKIFELAQKAGMLYEKQTMQEKHRILRFVFSNSSWKDGRLNPVYRKPFDFLVENNQRAKKRKATCPPKSGLSEIWLPFVDAYRELLLTPTPEMHYALNNVCNLE